MEQARRNVTLMLEAIGRNEPMVAAELLPLVYQELRSLARRAMAKERAGHTLQPTALAYDAYLKGRHFRDMMSEEGLRKSLESFQQALAHDPNFAPASWAGHTSVAAFPAADSAFLIG